MDSLFRARSIRGILTTASSLALIACAAFPALAQTNTTTPATSAGDEQSSDALADDILVRGYRASVETSLQVKRDADQIVDVITAEDVGKLPDQNIAESLQRVTGVQIERSQGEGSGVSVRGLTQNRFEVDGATLTGNDTGRGVNFESIPSELYSGIRVYKSPTADQVEGSLGATIRLTTIRPLDLRQNLLVAGSAQAAYSEYRDAWDPTISGLVAAKADTGIGEVAAVLSLSYQKRRLRNDFLQVVAWDRSNIGDRDRDGTLETATSGPLRDDDLYLPRQIRQVSQLNNRERVGGLFTFQWRPDPTFELRATANYLEYRFENDYRQIQFSTNRPAAATSNVTVSPDRTLSAATVTGVAFATQNFSTPTKQTNFNGQIELDWKPTDRLSASLLGSIGRGRNKPLLRIFSLLQQRSGQTLSYDFGADADLPTVSIANYDFTDINNYASNTVSTQRRDPRNDDNAVMIDLNYKVDSGFLKSIDLGGRYSDGGVVFDFYRVTANNLVGRLATVLQGQLPPGAFINTLPTGSDFLSGLSGNVPRGWVTYDASYLTGEGGRALLALSNLNPNAVPLDFTASWEVREQSHAAYAKANFDGDIGTLPFRGNLGIRWVKSDTQSTGFFPVPNSTAFAPQTFENGYEDWLPSANLTLYPAQDFLVRFAAAKVMSRPTFENLSAATTFMFATQVANAGNPFLKPFRVSQADVSFEWYFRRGDLLSLALFYKDVGAFITTERVITQGPDGTNTGTIDYILSRPANGTDGKVKGFEVAFEHAFVELPGVLSGFGIRANYTFIDSSTPNVDDITGETLPLQGLSRNSYNLTGYYEKYGAQARLSYNWRSDYVSSTFAGRPVFTQGTGRLDGSLSYDLVKGISLTLEAINLTKARDFNYFVVEERPLQIGVNDRRFLFGARARF